jgi:hypothetical protein
VGREESADVAADIEPTRTCSSRRATRSDTCGSASPVDIASRWETSTAEDIVLFLDSGVGCDSGLLREEDLQQKIDNSHPKKDCGLDPDRDVWGISGGGLENSLLGIGEVIIPESHDNP